MVKEDKPLEDVMAGRLAHPKYDFVYLMWQKGLSRLDEDRDGAVTAARTLIETTVKLVLDELTVPHKESWDLPKLYHEAASELGIAAKQHTDVLFRSFFGAAQTVVNSVGELRNKIGDAHGKGNLSYPASRSQAELAINLAGSICCFLVSTLESVVTAKKRIGIDGKIILKFNVITVWRLVDHARTSKASMSFYGKRLRKRSLCLVGDAGIYLISNGLQWMKTEI